MENLQTDKPTERMYFVDNLRTALVILVVLHHLSIVYSGVTPFYYVEPPTHDLIALLALMVFIVCNQAFFMGLFFLISGYFMPRSLNRKGWGTFMKDRLLRLGIPLLVSIFVLNPIACIGIYQMPASWTGITTPFTWQDYPKLIGAGPLWFVEMLLIFDFGYLVWWIFTRDRTTPPSNNSVPPSYGTIGAFILVLAIASYLLRIFIPMGKNVLGFPTLNYFPQYLSFFIIGIVAFHRNWFRTIPGSMGKVGFVWAVAATLILLPLSFSDKGAFLGYGTWQSGVYALWDSIFSVGICLGLITFFRHFYDHQGKLGRFLNQHAFIVYIIHTPIIILLALEMRGIHLEQLLKFGMASIIGVPLCFAAAYFIRKIPYATNIL